jgi:endonuclease YncB( thermonuclease family)
MMHMIRPRNLSRFLLVVTFLSLAACTLDTPTDDGSIISGGESALVTNIIDGDTIDVQIRGVGYRVRYIGINTPERDEPCYADATQANAQLVDGETVTLVRDESNTDDFGRLLRYVYVGNQMVNALLVQNGWAENAEYPPDVTHAATFRDLEADAARRNAGCHPTGIFDDGNARR